MTESDDLIKVGLRRRRRAAAAAAPAARVPPRAGPGTPSRQTVVRRRRGSDNPGEHGHESPSAARLAHGTAANLNAGAPAAGRDTDSESRGPPAPVSVT